ncbi:EamA family transporter [Sporomusa silvacetica]
MKIGLDSISPYNLIALRFGIAFICMALIFLPRFRTLSVSILAKGVLMGVLLFLLFSGLVYGVNYTTASTAGFLASTTVIIVPILESILKRRLPNKLIMLSILLAVIGLYLLCFQEMKLDLHDRLTFISKKYCLIIHGSLRHIGY